MRTLWQSPLPELQPVMQTLQLAPGQAVRVWLPVRSQIVCNAPLVRIAMAPQWLVDRLVSHRGDLADGQSMTLERSGWVEIQAPRGGEVLCLPSQARPWERRLAMWLLGKLRRSRQAAPLCR